MSANKWRKSNLELFFAVSVTVKNIVKISPSGRLPRLTLSTAD